MRCLLLVRMIPTYRLLLIGLMQLYYCNSGNIHVKNNHVIFLCKTYFVCLIFVVFGDYETFLTTKLSQITVLSHVSWFAA